MRSSILRWLHLMMALDYVAVIAAHMMGRFLLRNALLACGALVIPSYAVIFLIVVHWRFRMSVRSKAARPIKDYDVVAQAAACMEENTKISPRRHEVSTKGSPRNPSRVRARFLTTFLSDRARANFRIFFYVDPLWKLRAFVVKSFLSQPRDGHGHHAGIHRRPATKDHKPAEDSLAIPQWMGRWVVGLAIAGLAASPAYSQSSRRSRNPAVSPEKAEKALEIAKESYEKTTETESAKVSSSFAHLIKAIESAELTREINRTDMLPPNQKWIGYCSDFVGSKRIEQAKKIQEGYRVVEDAPVNVDWTFLVTQREGTWFGAKCPKMAADSARRSKAASTESISKSSKRECSTARLATSNTKASSLEASANSKCKVSKQTISQQRAGSSCSFAIEMASGGCHPASVQSPNGASSQRTPSLARNN